MNMNQKLVDKDMAMMKLVYSILNWWNEHEYDTVMYQGGDVGNVYEDEPNFVKLAKELRQ